MEKIKIALFVVLIISLFSTAQTYALSGDTFVDKKSNTLYIEEMLAVTFNAAFEANTYQMTAKAKAINPNNSGLQNVTSSTDTNNLVLDIDIEMDFAPKWFLIFDSHSTISSGTGSQNFPSLRSANLEYERSHLGFYIGRRFFFVPGNSDNLWQFKTYAGFRAVTTKTNASNISYPGVTITKQEKKPDNISDENETLEAVLGFSLSRRFNVNNFLEFYTELGSPLDNETTTSYNENFTEDASEGSSLEIGVKTTWRYTPQSFFAVGLYYGIITFKGGEIQELTYTENKDTLTTYYQWGENESTYWGISASWILKF